jgi:predicted deacetylase
VPRYASNMAEEERLTAQDLIYGASALRQATRTKEKKAVEPRLLSSTDAFEREARARDGLGAEFQRIAGAVWLVRAHVDLQRRR